MEKKTYIIRITTIDNLYVDYWIDAENIWFAKMRARAAFFRDYPDADKNIKLSLENPETQNIRELIDIIHQHK